MSTKSHQREKFDQLIAGWLALLSDKDRDAHARARLRDWIYGASRAAADMHVITHIEAEEIVEQAGGKQA